ncbi:hypothetical protein Hanom_Chr06g00566781 [Helianthus anomalus]
MGVAGKVEKEQVKSITVPDRTKVVKGLIGTAVVGRVVDLETLVDFDRLLRIAKISYAKRSNKPFWNKYSAACEPSGHLGSLVLKTGKMEWAVSPLERVAWLRLRDIPLHLFDPEVIVQGFQILVEEEHDIWVPDCLGPAVLLGSAGSSLVMPSPVAVMPTSGYGVREQLPVEDEGAGIDESPMDGSGSSHAVASPMQDERETVVGNDEEVGEGASRKLEGILFVGHEVLSTENGANRNCFFFSSSGKSVRVHHRKSFGPRLRRAQVHVVPTVSPENTRLKKRSRGAIDDTAPGFGYVGFTSRNILDKEGRPSTEVGGFDLNLRATPAGSHSIREEDLTVTGTNGVELEVDSVGPNSFAKKEVEETLLVGARIGVELRNLWREQGINLVSWS